MINVAFLKIKIIQKILPVTDNSNFLDNRRMLSNKDTLNKFYSET